MANFPTVTYSDLKHKVNGGYVNNAITYQDEAIAVSFNNALGGNTNFKVSYNAPYNKIYGKLTSNLRLLRFEARVSTIENATNNRAFGPTEGALITDSVLTNIAPDTLTSFEFTITPSTFSGSASNTYVICLLAQGEDMV